MASSSQSQKSVSPGTSPDLEKLAQRFAAERKKLGGGIVRRWPAELRAAAGALVSKRDVVVADVSAALGVSTASLGIWSKLPDCTSRSRPLKLIETPSSLNQEQRLPAAGFATTHLLAGNVRLEVPLNFEGASFLKALLGIGGWP